MNCLAQGHNAVTPVRLELAAIRSRVKHSTTEPLRLPKNTAWRDSLQTHSSHIRRKCNIGPDLDPNCLTV